jgi:RNA polymerase sigma-70 factor, ECF subfamily
VKTHDPLADPAPLIRRVYAYVAYRLGDGPEAEDVTSEVFERALRYRASYDRSRGEPVQWLLGIARRCVENARASRPALDESNPRDTASPEDLGGHVVQRVALAQAIDGLDDRTRDLIALRYGADLTARQIGEILGLTTNAVEVALHRALKRLRGELADDVDASRPARNPAPGVSP